MLLEIGGPSLAGGSSSARVGIRLSRSFPLKLASECEIAAVIKSSLPSSSCSNSFGGYARVATRFAPRKPDGTSLFASS